MGFTIDFTSLGQGITDLAAGIHRGKVDDYNKAQQELVNAINEYQSATTPEAKQAAQSKLDNLVAKYGSDPKFQQAYQQAAAGIDKFQAAYDTVKQNAPGSMNVIGHNGPYRYDANADSNFRFTGQSGVTDRYDEFGNTIKDYEQQGQFTSPQDYLNWLRAITADKDTWEANQISTHQKSLSDPRYVQSLGVPLEQAQNWTIDDIVNNMPKRMAARKAEIENSMFKSPYEQEVRDIKAQEEYDAWHKRKTEEINLEEASYARRLAMSHSYDKPDGGYGSSKGIGFGTDAGYAKERLKNGQAQMKKLEQDMAENPTMQPFLDKAGIPEAGYNTAAKLAVKLSTLATNKYGKEWQSLTPEERASVEDEFTTELKKTLPKARVLDLQADVRKVGNMISEVPQGEWTAVNNTINQYYSLDQQMRDDSVDLAEKAVAAWQYSLDEWEYLRGQNPNVSLMEVLQKNDIVIPSDKWGDLNAAVQTHNQLKESLSSEPQGSPKWNKTNQKLRQVEEQINSMIVTGGYYTPVTTQQLLNTQNKGTVENLYDKMNVTDPNVVRSMESVKTKGDIEQKGKQTFPKPKSETMSVNPEEFSNLRGDMSMFIRTLTPQQRADAQTGNGSYALFKRYMNYIPSSNPSALKIRQKEYQDAAYAQFLEILNQGQ